MKIYVINLDRSKDRLDHMKKLFADQGLEFIRIPAVDGRSLSADIIKSYTAHSPHSRQPSPAEIGCFLSHRECLRRIAEGEDDFAAIFEDDIILSPNAHLFLQDESWLNSTFDIIKLDMMDMKCLIGSPAQKLPLDYALAPLLSKHYGAAGYIISRSCAAQISTNITQITGAIDEIFFDPYYGLVNKYNIQQLTPAIVKQVGFTSNIQPTCRGTKRTPSNLPITKKIIRECKRTKERKLWPFVMTVFKGCRWGKIPFK